MGDDLQFKPVQHSVKLTDEAWAATLERAELESTTASEICERLLALPGAGGKAILVSTAIRRDQA